MKDTPNKRRFFRINMPALILELGWEDVFEARREAKRVMDLGKPIYIQVQTSHNNTFSQDIEYKKVKKVLERIRTDA